jgi:hypothetical protein
MRSTLVEAETAGGRASMPATLTTSTPEQLMMLSHRAFDTARSIVSAAARQEALRGMLHESQVPLLCH